MRNERNGNAMRHKNFLFGMIYGLVLTAFTFYAVLDTFVIARVYSSAPVSTAAENAAAVSSVSDNAEESSSSALSTDGKTASLKNVNPVQSTPSVSAYSYQDENISIEITAYREYDTTIYVADVQLSSAEYLKTAFARSAYGKNVTQKTSEIAEQNGAILAVNGDYYGVQENGYVLRNGVLYRSSAAKNREDLVIYSDGSFAIIQESSVSAEQLLADGAVQILSFGPALIADGSISVDEDDEVGNAKSSNPRTAIGIIDDLHYLFVVSDGRTDESEGLSLYELAQFMENLGAETAYNLDGGGSSTMYFNGAVVNNPTSTGNSIKERSVSDIVCIGY